MADDIILNNGSGGARLATDEAGVPAKHYQYVKLADGTADSEAKIAGDAANGLDVDVTRVQGTVTVGDGGGSLTVDAPNATPVPVAITDTANTLVKSGDATNNAIRVNVVAGVGGTHVDDAAFTPATDDGVPIFGVFDDVTPDSVDEGDAGAVRMSANRNLYVRIRDNAGNERGLNIDAQGNLSTPKSSTASAPAQSSIGTTAGVAIASNASRKGFMIQNTGTTVLKLTFSSTNPTQTAYHIALKGGSVADDANGMTYADDLWTGDVRIISSVAGGLYVATEWT